MTELIHGDAAFQYARDGALWYRTASGFLFPVAFGEIGTATFPAKDRGIFFMRWISRHVGEIAAARKEQEEGA